MTYLVFSRIILLMNVNLMKFRRTSVLFDRCIKPNCLRVATRKTKIKLRCPHNILTIHYCYQMKTLASRDENCNERIQTLKIYNHMLHNQKKLVSPRSSNKSVSKTCHYSSYSLETSAYQNFYLQHAKRLQRHENQWIY